MNISANIEAKTTSDSPSSPSTQNDRDEPSPSRPRTVLRAAEAAMDTTNRKPSETTNPSDNKRTRSTRRSPWWGLGSTSQMRFMALCSSAKAPVADTKTVPTPTKVESRPAPGEVSAPAIRPCTASPT